MPVSTWRHANDSMSALCGHLLPRHLKPLTPCFVCEAFCKHGHLMEEV